MNKNDISDAFSGILGFVLLAAAIITCAPERPDEIAPPEEPVGETILEEEPTDGPPLHLIKESDELHEIVTLEPARTQLLIDYVNGEKPSKCFVKPIMEKTRKGKVTWNAVHVIETKVNDRWENWQYTLRASADRLVIWSRLDHSKSLIGWPTHVGTPTGFIHYVGDFVSENEAYQFITCPAPDPTEPCIEENAQDLEMQQAKWKELNEFLINYYESGC